MAGNRHSYALTEEGLTQQEEDFLSYIMQGMPKAAAVRNAGYKFKDGRRGADKILERPPVVARLAQLRAEAREKAKFTQDQVLDGLEEAINDAKLAGDPGNQIAGWREIAKILGYYAPETKKVEISHTQMKAQQQLASLPEDELMKLAGGSVIDGEFRLIDND
jgi:phage terminase small subunit